MNLTEFSKEVHDDNVIKGFYEDYDRMMHVINSANESRDIIMESTEVARKAFIDQRLALIVSEVGEAVECNRKNLRANLRGVVPGFEEEYFKQAFKVHVKDTLEDEVADIIIRCLDLAGFLEIDIQKHVDLKLKYNKLRAYKHGKAY